MVAAMIPACSKLAHEIEPGEVIWDGTDSWEVAGCDTTEDGRVVLLDWDENPYVVAPDKAIDIMEAAA
jgi:hypothetical protein